jgi:hypothetical protein
MAIPARQKFEPRCAILIGEKRALDLGAVAQRVTHVIPANIFAE